MRKPRLLRFSNNVLRRLLRETVRRNGELQAELARKNRIIQLLRGDKPVAGEIIQPTMEEVAAVSVQRGGR